MIGNGAYGEVVEAINIITKEKVAIKYINNSDEAEYACVKTLREIQIMKKLS